MNNNCLANILKVIDVLQNNAEDRCNENNTCTRPILGILPDNICYNTRMSGFKGFCCMPGIYCVRITWICWNN